MLALSPLEDIFYLRREGFTTANCACIETLVRKPNSGFASLISLSLQNL